MRRKSLGSSARWLSVLTLWLAIGFADVASAQSVTVITAASTLNFQPSADHASLDLLGNAVVTGYKVVYCLAAAPSNCLPSVSVGKPSPNASGEIVIPNVIASIQPNAAYVARAVATGPGGDSDPSNVTVPFGNAVPVKPAPPTAAKIVK